MKRTAKYADGWLPYMYTPEQLRAAADREREIILATAYESSEKLKGEGDAEATSIYANAFGKDAEFYAFTRRLQAYEKILTNDTTLVLNPDSQLLNYLQSPGSSLLASE